MNGSTLFSFTTSDLNKGDLGTENEILGVYNAVNIQNILKLIISLRDNLQQIKSYIQLAKGPLGTVAGISAEQITQVENIVKTFESLLADFAPILSVNNIVNEIKYDLEFRKVDYYTADHNGNAIEVSALLVVPQTSTLAPTLPTTLPLLSYQHATLSNKDQAPSLAYSECTSVPEGLELNSASLINMDINDLLDCDLLRSLSSDSTINPSFFFIVLLAARGYFTVVPDYIGYGTSADVAHPYINRQTSATAVVDGIRAGRQLAPTLSPSISLSSNAYLTGYSEGGFTTMAAKQMIEEIYNDEFSLAKTVAGAGPYAIEKSLDEFYLEENTSLDIDTFKLIEAAFNAFVDIYGSHFSESLQPFVRNGEDVVTAFVPNFNTRYKAQEEASLRLVKQFWELNSVYNWQPMNGKTVLFHGTNDRVVPFLNTEEAFSSFTSNSNSAEIIKDGSCTTTPDAHGGCVIYYLKRVLEELTAQ